MGSASGTLVLETLVLDYAVAPLPAATSLRPMPYPLRYRKLLPTQRADICYLLAYGTTPPTHDPAAWVGAIEAAAAVIHRASVLCDWALNDQVDTVRTSAQFSSSMHYG